MSKTISVSIPVACGEKWSSFAPTASGGFCGSCQKNVIDFTKATDDEIIRFLSKKPVHACGRFRSGQLKTYALAQPVNVKPGFLLLQAGAISLLLLLLSKPATAQTRNTITEQHVSDKSGNQPRINSSSLITVRGIVKSAEDGMALPGVSVFQKGTTVNTVTDQDGRYSLTLCEKGRQVVTFSFIGLVSKEITVSDATKDSLNIVLESDVTGQLDIIILGEPSLDEVYAEPATAWKRFWYRMKNLF